MEDKFVKYLLTFLGAGLLGKAIGISLSNLTFSPSEILVIILSSVMIALVFYKRSYQKPAEQVKKN